MGNMQETYVENRLRAALVALGLKPDLCARPLLEAYQGRDRFYHNLRHIGDCLALIEKLGNTAPPITLALCYHDVVYDSRAKDNEERSAEWARRDLADLGAVPELIREIVRLILATAHRTPPQAEDEQLIVDVDLSILGKSEEVYDRYAAAVRKEYGWVPDQDYRKGRGQFLRGMLARSNIFSTNEMRKGYEQSARNNLKRELEDLENHES